MHYWGQSSPLTLHARIGLQLYLGFSPLNSVLLIPRNQVGKEERIGALGTILWKNADEKEVNDVGLVLLDGSQHVEPSEWQQSASAALSQGMSQRRHGDSYADELMLSTRPILDTGDEVEVEETEIRLDKLVYLLLLKF